MEELPSSSRQELSADRLTPEYKEARLHWFRRGAVRVGLSGEFEIVQGLAKSVEEASCGQAAVDLFFNLIEL